MRLPRLLLALSACLPWMLAASPVRAAETDFQLWSPIVIQGDISKRWRGFFEIQPRFSENASTLDRAIIRPAVGYRLDRHHSVWLGYLYSPVLEPEFTQEHRVFQQFLAEHSVGKLALVNRTRLEERFLEDVHGTPLRLRHMLRLSHPLDPKKRWSVIAYDEVFWNLNTVSGGPEAGFDQNRLFVGLGRVLNKNARLEAGYLWNWVDRPGDSPNRSNNVLVTSLVYTW